MRKLFLLAATITTVFVAIAMTGNRENAMDMQHPSPFYAFVDGKLVNINYSPPPPMDYPHLQDDPGKNIRHKTQHHPAD